MRVSLIAYILLASKSRRLISFAATSEGPSREGNEASAFFRFFRLVLAFFPKTVKATVKPRFNDLRFSDIPGITISIRLPGKSYNKMYGAEPQFNDLRFNDLPGLTMVIFVPRTQNLSQYNDKINMTDHKKCSILLCALHLPYPLCLLVVSLV